MTSVKNIISLYVRCLASGYKADTDEDQVSIIIPND